MRQRYRIVRNIYNLDAAQVGTNASAPTTVGKNSNYARYLY